MRLFNAFQRVAKNLWTILAILLPIRENDLANKAIANINKIHGLS